MSFHLHEKFNHTISFMKNQIKKLLFLATMALVMPSVIYAGNEYLQKGDYQDAYSLGNGKVHVKQLIFAEGT